MAHSLWHPKGSFNYGRLDNPKVNEIIEMGRKELDMEKRQKIYWDLETMLYENYLDIWIYYPLIIRARSKRLMGWDEESYQKGGEYYSFSHRNWFKDGRRE